MSFLSGACTLRHFSLEAPEGFSTANVEEGLAEACFREPLAPTDAVVSGLVDAEAILETDWWSNLNRWSYGSYAYFGLRVDQRKVDGKTYRARVAQAIHAWCQEHHRERAPASVREEIKESIRHQMVRATPPKTQVTTVILDLHAMRAWAEGSDLTEDRLRKLLHRSFGVRAQRRGPLHKVSPEVLGALLTHDALLGPTLRREAKTVDDDESLAIGPLTRGGFFLALWAETAMSGEPETLIERVPDRAGLQVWAQGPLELRAPDGEGAVVWVNRTPQEATEVRTALRRGLVPCSIGLSLRVEDREYQVRLSDPYLTLEAARLPSLVRVGDVAERLYERMFLLEELRSLVDALFLAWADLRSSPDWEPHRVALQAWVDDATGGEVSDG